MNKKIDMGKMMILVRHYGVKHMIIGLVHIIRNMILQKKYRFGKWHLTPIEFREYAMYIKNKANDYITRGVLDKNGLMVEIGCGLGEIMGGTDKKQNWYRPI